MKNPTGLEREIDQTALKLYEKVETSSSGTYLFYGSEIERIANSFPNARYSSVMIDEMLKLGFIRQKEAITDELAGRYEITASLIAHVTAILSNASQETISSTIETPANHIGGPVWNIPDTTILPSQTALMECKKHIADALHIIATSEFSQSEISQIRGLLKICEDALELPVPKLSIVRHVLHMLRGIREIAEYVKFISDFLDTFKS